MQPTLVTTGMHYWRLAPDPRLHGLVSCYWVVDGLPRDRQRRALEPTEDLLIPDGLAEIVFNRSGEGFQRWRLGEPQGRELMAGSYLIGGRARSVNTRAPKPLQLAGVKLDARFLRALIRRPLHEFRDATLSLAALGDAQLLTLEDSIGNARCVATVVGLLDNFFLAALRGLRRGRSAVDALVERIHRDHGGTRILEWTRAAHVDARGLERAFCAGLGMTPKQYARVIRFKRQYQRLITRSGAAQTLGDSLEGFYDQSHFNREFQHFTGTAPSARLAGRMSQDTQVADHLIAANQAG